MVLAYHNHKGEMIMKPRIALATFIVLVLLCIGVNGQAVYENKQNNIKEMPESTVMLLLGVGFIGLATVSRKNFR